MQRLALTLGFLSLGLFACSGGGVGDDDGLGGSGSSAQCVDPGVTLDWILTMPSGDEFRADSRFGKDQPNVPIDVTGIVSLDGTKLVIPTASGNFELAFTESSVPLETGIPAGAAVHVKGLLNDNTASATESNRRWRLDLEIRNDPAGGVEVGDRLFLVTGAWVTPEGSAIAVEMSDSCELSADGSQRGWLVAEVGEPQVLVPEGGSHQVEVTAGPDAGSYEFLGGDGTTFGHGDVNLELGSSFLIRRAPE